MLASLNILIIVFTLVYCIYILWQVIAWVIQPNFISPKNNFKTKVSLIIPCRNEESNIANCLESVLKQEYPQSLIEIIVVDDHSEDKTIDTVKYILNKSPIAWKCISLNTADSNKKKTIEAAIKDSCGELIIITDADCTSNKNWVSSIVALYEEKNHQMICGPVAIIDDNTFCKKFQALELSGLSVLAGSGIFTKHPLLCNGANIAYTRKAFEEVNGFDGNENIPTGDDTFLLFKINKQYKNHIGFIKSTDAIVYTKAQPDWGSFLSQRIRWGSKGFHSNNQINSIISALVFITNLLLLVYTAGCFVYFSVNLVIISCIIVKFTVDFFLLTCGVSFFKRHKLLLYFLLSEFITMFYVSLVGFRANFSSYHWKGREYRTKT